MREPISIHACDHIYVKDVVVEVSGVSEKVVYVYCKEMGEYIYISPIKDLGKAPRAPTGKGSLISALENYGVI